MKQLKQTIQYLEAARELIEPKGSWTQGALARNKYGHEIDVDSRNACRFCTIGALARVSEIDLNYFTPSVRYLASSFGADLAGLNDHVNTKQIHVQMAYDFAILQAKDDLKAARKAAKNA